MLSRLEMCLCVSESVITGTLILVLRGWGGWVSAGETVLREGDDGPRGSAVSERPCPAQMPDLLEGGLCPLPVWSLWLVLFVRGVGGWAWVGSIWTVAWAGFPFHRGVSVFWNIPGCVPVIGTHVKGCVHTWLHALYRLATSVR